MTSSSSKTLSSSTRTRSLLRDEAGFNLIEIMVVLVITRINAVLTGGDYFKQMTLGLVWAYVYIIPTPSVNRHRAAI